MVSNVASFNLNSCCSVAQLIEETKQLKFKRMEKLVSYNILLFFILFLTIDSIVCSKSEEIDNLIKGENNVIDKGEGLIVKIIKEKKNCKKVAEIGDHLDVHYVGRINDENGRIFDESRPKGHVYKFQLGAGEVFIDLGFQL